MDNFDEAEVVIEAKKNDQSFIKLYETYLGKIYKYIYYRVNSREEAEDLTSDVFHSALRSLPKFNLEKGSFLAWLYTIAHNKVIDYYKKSSKKDLNLADFESQLESPDLSSKEHNREYLRVQVAQVLGELRPRYQQIISLKFFSELTLGEIAKIMNCKAENVSVLLFRALKRFEEKLLKKIPKSEILELFNRQ